MKLLRSQTMVLVLCVCALLSGCYSVLLPLPARTQEYSKVLTLDFEGRKIAEFIAEGRVARFEGGYRFWAVQRRIFEPTTLEFHYPLGRPVTVKAPNIIVTPASKPVWLSRLDGSRPICGKEVVIPVDPPHSR